MKIPVYPLAEVLKVKQKRVEDQEKVVAATLEKLRREEETLKVKERDRDKVKDHLQSKMDQLRQELDGGTTSPRIQQMKAYLKVVVKNLEVEEKKVKEQQEKVKLVEKEVEEAKKLLKRRELEVDKLTQHRKEWTLEMRRELEIVEAREQDELGSAIFNLRKRRGW